MLASNEKSPKNKKEATNKSVTNKIPQMKNQFKSKMKKGKKPEEDFKEFRENSEINYLSE